MEILSQGRLEDFARKHGDARKQAAIWRDKVLLAAWRNTVDLKADFAKASILPDNVVIFDIKGNNYRIETKVGYALQTVEILFAGTHPEYDKRNKKRRKWK